MRVRIEKFTLQDAKILIRRFIQMHWSDQKLAEVYAFNRDGKMRYDDACGCIRGVTLSDTLHTEEDKPCCPSDHYVDTVHMEGAREAERGYLRLHRFTWAPDQPEFEGLAQRRLSAILRAEMRRRERARHSAVIVQEERASVK